MLNLTKLYGYKSTKNLRDIKIKRKTIVHKRIMFGFASLRNVPKQYLLPTRKEDGEVLNATI